MYNAHLLFEFLALYRPLIASAPRCQYDIDKIIADLSLGEIASILYTFLLL